MGVTEAHKEEFVQAVSDANADAARALLERDPALREQIDAPWLSFDSPAIVHAAGKRAMVDVLLEFGADVNAESSWWAGGFTAMHSVAGRMVGFNEEMAHYLIERGAEVDAWAAAGLGMRDRLAAIVSADPPVVDRPGPDGMWPLHYAASPGIARFLIDSGADIDARCIDHHGTAAQWGLGFTNMELTRFLLDEGAEALPQPVVPGNVAQLGAGDADNLSGLTVFIKLTGDLLSEARALPNPFTPNGDGINDRTEIFYDVLNVTDPTPVEVNLYDLAGRRIHTLHTDEILSGRYAVAWGGTDERGQIVPPGLYVFKVEVRADEKKDAKSGTIAVVY